MIEVINSKELKTNTDMVCTHCGIDHDMRNSNGDTFKKEGIDYVFETDGNVEWCICVNCKGECDKEAERVLYYIQSIPGYLRMQ